MPRYEFRCDGCDEDFDVVTTISEYAEQGVFLCPEGHEGRRLFSMPAVKLSGPGYYKTDYANLDKQKSQGRERVRSGEVKPQADLTRYE